MSEPTTTGVKVTLRTNGPLMVEGDVKLVDVDGREIASPGPKIFLCRCGASSAKPFCDGAHNRVGFQAGTPRPTT